MSSSPPARKVRFDPEDVIIDRDTEDSESELEYQEPPLTTPSPTQSSSTASSSAGLRTPPGDASASLEPKVTIDGEESPDPLLHKSVSMKGSFYWDMAVTPGDLDHLRAYTDAAVGVDGLSKEPLTQLTLVIDGLYHWNIKVLPSAEEFCTVHDTFLSIYNELAKFVTKAEVDRHDRATQKRIFHARELRCHDTGLDVHQEPLRRVDYLCGARRFLGISSCGTPGHFRLHVGVLPSTR